MSARYRFDRFELDSGNRQLTRDGAPVELNARYFDALELLVREHGQLVSKDRFFADVWQGVPVTDEALTQCIKALRKQLGDDAGRPRFIETAPKHGYRFIAPVTAGGTAAAPGATPTSLWPTILRLGLGGAIGGAVAGMFGGLFYSAAGATVGDGGGASALIVLVCVCIGVGFIGGGGVGLGIATASALMRRAALAHIVGGAAGGLAIGALVKLLGLDAFNLLFGQSPGEITGGGEGALLGAGVGVGAWLATRGVSFRRGVAFASLIGLAAGALIHLIGGRLMAGSLATLAAQFPNSRLRLDEIGALFGEPSFGPITQAITTSLEAGLFAACVVAALSLARR